MNNSLLKQHAAFKQQHSSTIASVKHKPTPESDSSPKKKVKQEPKHQGPRTSTTNKFKWIKSCVDLLKKRHRREKKALSFVELIQSLGLSDLEVSEKEWLEKAMHENPKISYEKGKISFKPAYPIHNKSDLVTVLRQHYDNGMGGLLMEDVKECMSHAEQIIEELVTNDQVFTLTRPDKQTILYFRDTTCEVALDDEFKELWNSISVKEMGEVDIENYLKRVGIRTMEGFGLKRKAVKKGTKRKRNVKMLNSHLGSDMLKEFD